MIEKATQDGLISYWKSLVRKDGQKPLKKDFDPSKIKNYLPNIILAELVDPDFLKIRVTGTNIDALLKTNLTGSNLFDMSLQKYKELLYQIYKAIGEAPCGYFGERSIVLADGDIYPYTITVLPFEDDTNNNLCFLVWVYFEKKVFETKKKRGFTVRDKSVWEYIDLGFGIPDYPKNKSTPAELK